MNLHMTRRGFFAAGLAAASTARSLAATVGQPRLTVHPRGMFISECGIAGETRADDVFPADPNGMRLSRNRYLIIYETRGWRGTDDDRSIIYQVRANGYDGPVLKEGVFAVARNDWDALGDGKHYILCHGHPMAFGVPKGALIRGKPAANANLFVAKWYKYARVFFAPGQIRNARETSDLSHRTMHVEWTQFRLNEAEDDIEILAPARALQRKGEEGAPRPGMNQGLAAPVPFTDDATEWIDVHSIITGNDSHLAALRFRYDPRRHRYDWVETGPALFDPKYRGWEATAGAEWIPSEASVVRISGDDWAICARSVGLPALWLRANDPFGKSGGRVYAQKDSERPTVIGPIIAYRCADGKIRILSGDKQTSPYQKPRDPLYCWDVDPDRGFAQTNRRVVFDGRKTLPQVRPDAYVMADFAKVLPHAGGNAQTILHRVRTWSINYDVPGKGPALLPHEKLVQGIYCAHLEYDQHYPDVWTFGSQT